MPKNKVEDLRNHLFETLESLKDCESDKLDESIRRAEAVVKVSGAIIDTARVEVAHAKVLNEMMGSAFLDPDGESKFFDARNKLGTAPANRRLA
jgi:hypothetical protein